jgi:hypothetical protein
MSEKEGDKELGRALGERDHEQGYEGERAHGGHRLGERARGKG